MPSRIDTNDIDNDPEEVHEDTPSIDNAPAEPKRLILCFDGTGNSFQGNPSDTNIVKLYHKFDRESPRQYHYYQPGIGTYTAGTASLNAGFMGRFSRSISENIDFAIGTTFDAHVVAGYRFLMRYYDSGDRIYIFGFSRGAFTARFLARMIYTVGLLSKGNDEMVPFAYKLYQDYELGIYNAQKNDTEGDEGSVRREDYISMFRSTFCRQAHREGSGHSAGEAGIKAHFLGLFETVNSVGVFDVPFGKTRKPPLVQGTAEHVRHAVAVDERRVKFKAALLQQDISKANDLEVEQEDIKEVWFPGQHGDVGGGWMPEHEQDSRTPGTFWGWVKGVFSRKQKKQPATHDLHDDSFQLSDISLKWMMDEIDALPGDQIKWNEYKDGFMRAYKRHDENAADPQQRPIKARLHDSLSYGGGESGEWVTFWTVMEYLPFIRRWEYVNKVWEYIWWPLNRGERRDIPPGAVLHPSVIERHTLFNHYLPGNDIWASLESVKADHLANVLCRHCGTNGHAESGASASGRHDGEEDRRPLRKNPTDTAISEYYFPDDQERKQKYYVYCEDGK